MTNKSRSELLSWINASISSSYTRIEQLGDGVAYSKILASLHPDFPIHKIKLSPNTEVQYIHNLKTLQSFLDSLDFQIQIPIQKLVLLRFQDNLEFCQAFFKHFATPKNQKQKPQTQKPQKLIETLENERNFYFNRLKHIESIIKQPQISKDDLILKIEDALYQQHD